MLHTSRLQSDLYERLRLGDMSALTDLYPRLHQRVAKLIRQHGGASDDVTDTLHEAILATVYNIRYNRYVWTGEAELTTYIIAVARNIWLASQRNQQRFVRDASPAEPASDSDDELADLLLFERQRQVTEEGLGQLDGKCRRTLELYYWEKLPLAEVARQQGWANEAVARKNKSNCLRKLRQWVNDRLANTSL